MARAKTIPASHPDYLKKILTAKVYDVAIESALEPARNLSRRIGNPVLLKREDQQPVFSFKLRGAYNKMVHLAPEQLAQGVICASAGNHAQGVALSAKKLGCRALIVMPVTTPKLKIDAVLALGGEVVLHGDSFSDAYDHALGLQRDQGLTFVHPFDDLDVMAGQGTVALEMLEDVPDLEILPIPIGGGGLIAGMATAAKHMNQNIKVFGLEPAIIPSFTAKMRGVRTPQNGGASTIAEGIAVKVVGENTYAIARPLIDEVLLIEEPYFERGIALYCNVEKTVAEGAGAASLAALLAYPDKFRDKKCGLVITGGNIDTRLLASVLTRELVRESRIVSLRIIGDDRPGLLANVSMIIGQMGANIIEVAHNRLALDVPAKGAEFDVMIETRDAQHTQEVMDALRDRGYPPRVV